MTELEKIAYAKLFIDKLANGINPIDDSPVSQTDIVNNVRISRCLFYVSDILRQVVENGGLTNEKTPRQKKNSFSLTIEEREKIQISKTSMTISEIAKYLNSLVDLEKTKKISANAINEWLLEMGFLCTITLSDNKHRRAPTAQGNQIGIYTEERNGQYGKYVSVLFSSSAQQFIYDNIDEIVAFKENNK